MLALFLFCFLFFKSNAQKRKILKLKQNADIQTIKQNEKRMQTVRNTTKPGAEHPHQRADTKNELQFLRFAVLEYKKKRTTAART